MTYNDIANRGTVHIWGTALSDDYIWISKSMLNELSEKHHAVALQNPVLQHISLYTWKRINDGTLWCACTFG